MREVYSKNMRYAITPETLSKLVPVLNSQFKESFGENALLENFIGRNENDGSFSQSGIVEKSNLKSIVPNKSLVPLFMIEAINALNKTRSKPFQYIVEAKFLRAVFKQEALQSPLNPQKPVKAKDVDAMLKQLEDIIDIMLKHANTQTPEDIHPTEPNGHLQAA